MRVLFFLLLLSVATVVQSQSERFHIPNSQIIITTDMRGERNYELYIKLPSSYTRENYANHYYPTIYLTDASTAFPLVSAATQVPMNSGKMIEAIIVGISWEQGVSAIDSRVLDYTPTNDADWNRATGGAAEYLGFLSNNVFPLVEENFRSDPDRRIFGGHSLGGLFGAYVLSRQPDTFFGYVLGSPSLWFDSKHLIKQAQELTVTDSFLSAKVYLGVGSLESPAFSGAANNLVADTREYFSLLQGGGKDSTTLELFVVPDAIHETAFPATIMQGLYWILGI